MKHGMMMIALLGLCLGAKPATKATRPATTTKPETQQACLPETDPASPRKSKLSDDKSQIIRDDLDNDGDPDVLECWFNNKRCRWIDENDDMKSTDVRGDQSMDSLQVDRDGDGYYDGPEDINIKWGDDDGDGRADIQCFAANPKLEQKSTHSGTSHWMMYIDVDHDGVNGYIDWTTFEFNAANWRVPPTTSPTRTIPPPNFSPDYMGNSIFLKQHLPAWVSTDPRYNWENPFAFYDFDGDGCTEMSIRLLDTTTKNEGGEPSETYRGFDNEAMGGFDLDNDSQKDNEFDFDMSIKFTSEADGSKGDRIDYGKYRDKHPSVKAPQWVLDAKLFRFDIWRKIDEFIYVTHDKCFEEMWKTNWATCWLTFDEDDDDHRWERVELYYPTDDVYCTSRWKSGARKGGGLDGHGQSDTLGDRGEWDNDNSGKGKLYIGRWDRKIHLNGAESGAWTVDYGAKYWGSSPVLGNSSPEKAPKVEEVVQYKDTDNNGFFDEITFDYDGDRKIDLTVSLKGDDIVELINPAEVKWQGLHELFVKIAHDSFQDGLKIYHAAWKKGLTNPQIDDLAIATSNGDQYDHGYWLKEKIFRMIDQKLAEKKDQRDGLRRAYFLGDVDSVVKFIDALDLRDAK